MPDRDARDDGVRLDIWLDVACLYRTRSEAQKACRSGKIDVNGQPGKANRIIRPGDELKVGRPFGRHQRIIVRDVAAKHVSRAAARELYEDLTPKPTAEEIELRRVERAYRAAITPAHSPDKRERRALRRLKGRQD